MYHDTWLPGILILLLVATLTTHFVLVDESYLPLPSMWNQGKVRL